MNDFKPMSWSNDDKPVVENLYGGIIEKISGSTCQSLSFAINIMSTETEA